MRFFGIEIRRAEKALSAVPDRGWFHLIREPFTGAWQRNKEETRESLLAYPTLFACISRISTDIGKLPFELKRRDANGIWRLTDNPAYSPVLRKPNHYQTAQQFREAWALSCLQHGNAYILKQRDNRGVVTKLHVLDPRRVKPLVADSGDVFYELASNELAQSVEDNIVVPAREMIHDREVAVFHPLVGVPPLSAAYWPAVKNLKILRNAATFFGNGANPGGILIAPGSISKETAERLSEHWNSNYSGENAGRVAVVGDGLKYEAMAENAADSQLVEQLRYSDEQICQPFGIPPFKVGIGTIPAGLKVDDINNLYYADALQSRIERMEALLDEGLGISLPLGVELDLYPLLRMDREKQARVEGEMVKGSIMTPNEARASFDLEPLDGGDTVYMQQQNYSLAALAERDANKPFATPTPAAPALAAEEAEPDVTDKSLHLLFRKNPEGLCYAA